MSTSQFIKKTIIGLWFVFILSCLIAYVYDPAWFSPKNIADFLSNYQGQVLLLYLLVSIIRGFSLLPSTPFVIAGTLLFPDKSWIVFWVSILGITTSSSLIYFFSDFLGFTDFFKKRFPKKIQQIKTILEKPYGVFFIFFWSVFPFVPTDLISYVAGSMKLNFWKFIIPLFLGECLLVGSIVCMGSFFLEWLS
jgi:uncharacterized membrane protein YdjX (TVP38/TMEM64 family)